MPQQGMVDKNSMRAGAAISAVVLLVAFVLQWHAAVAVMALVLGIGAILGLRYSPLGMTYRAAKSALKLNIPVDPEEQAPPRFAMTLGFIVLTLGALAFYVLDSDALGWTFALMVAALQTLLAATGLCVGCEIYLFTRRLTARSA